MLCITAKGKPVKAKTLGQKRYMEAIRKNTIVMGVGPAGTGKTYLAVAAAVAAFREKKVSRIILTRPAVEAGEKLGFLPGDLQSKVDPYLRPLYDGLFDMLGAENFTKYQERGSIEVAPLAYMRGRTLDDSFIILDEAQNTTPEQMKMFLTRLGFGSKAVITGDITQIDLPGGKQSGLREALRVLDHVEGIAQCYLTEKDVVRHELVQHIVKAYAEYESKKKPKDRPEAKPHRFVRRRRKNKHEDHQRTVYAAPAGALHQRFETEVKDADSVRELIEKVREERARAREHPVSTRRSTRVVDAEEIRRLNAEFRDKDVVTDVLSFPMYEFYNGEPREELDEEPDTGCVMLGDMVLCYTRACEQAEEYGHSAARVSAAT